MVDYTKNRKTLVPVTASKWVSLGAWTLTGLLVLWSFFSLLDNIGVFCTLLLSLYVLGMALQVTLARSAEDGLTVKECCLMAVWPKEAFALIRAGGMNKDDLRKMFEAQHVNAADDKSKTLVSEEAARWVIIGLMIASAVSVVISAIVLSKFVALIAVTLYVVTVAMALQADRTNGYTMGELLAALTGPFGIFVKIWRVGRAFVASKQTR